MNTSNIIQFECRLIKNKAELFAAQKLRYKVFVDEFGAKVSQANKNRAIETDKFDRYCDHLVLLDKGSANELSEPKVIGTMRLMESNVAQKNLGFYSAKEFNLDRLLQENMNSLEIGRACVDKSYRSNTAIHFLWLGLANYVRERNISLMFGVASFPGRDSFQFGSALTFLKNKYSAPERFDFKAKSAGYVNMNIVSPNRLDPKAAVAQIPSLLKSYLRMGAKVSDGAFVDSQFNTVDVGVFLFVDRMSKRYRKFYSQRKNSLGLASRKRSQ